MKRNNTQMKASKESIDKLDIREQSFHHRTKKSLRVQQPQTYQLQSLK